MIDVKFLNVLAISAGRASCAVEVAAGESVRQLVRELGLDEKLVQLVILNGKIKTLDAILVDGDQVTLSALVAGG
jgi:sulfur carrier protein ThiS